MRAMVDLRAVVDIKDVYQEGGFIDPVDDPVGASPGTVTSGEGPEQRLADAMRVDRERGIAKLEHGSGNALREPLGDRSPCGRLEPDLVSLLWFDGQAPVARRRARS